MKNKKNQNRPIASKQTESVIKNLLISKSQDQMALLMKSTKYFKKNECQSFSNLQKMKEAGVLPTSLMRPHYHDTKARKRCITRQENFRSISLIRNAKILHKLPAN